MDLRINSYNNFGSRMILNDFGIRSDSAVRWANISKIFEQETQEYPDDEIIIEKKKLKFSFKINNKVYIGGLGYNKSNSYNQIMKLSDDEIAKKFAKMNKILRESQSIVESSKEHILKIVNLFTYAKDKNHATDRLLEEIDTLSSCHVTSSFDNDDVLNNFIINWYDSDDATKALKKSSISKNTKRK